MEKKEASWEKGLFLICTKCGTKIDKSTLLKTGEPADNMRDTLRAGLKSADKNKQVRVITSGCLSVCIEGTQAVGYLPKEGGITEVWTVQPEKEDQDVLNYLLKK